MNTELQRLKREKQAKEDNLGEKKKCQGSQDEKYVDRVGQI